MAYEYSTITVDMNLINNTTESGQLKIYWYGPMTLGNGDTIAPNPLGKTFNLTSGAASITLAAADGATVGRNQRYKVAYIGVADTTERVLGSILVTTTTGTLSLATLLAASIAATSQTLTPDASRMWYQALTTAAMQALANLNNGDRVFVNGRGLYRAEVPPVTPASGYLALTSTDGLARFVLDEDGMYYRPTFNVLHYGADPTGISDSAAALTAALTAAGVAGGVAFVPPGTFTVASAVTIPSGVTLQGVRGQSIIQAKAATDFITVITATSASNICIRDLVVDVNQANRSAALTTTANGIGLTSCSDCLLDGVTVKNTLGTLLASATAIAISGTARNTIVNCLVINCGTTTKPSDGIYTTGTQTLIANCTAKNCTDTGFVLERSNQSGIVGCTALSCGCGAGITNASVDIAYDNYIDGLTIYDWAATVTGGLQIGNPSPTTTGNLVNTSVSGVVMRNATGSGPGLYVNAVAAWVASTAYALGAYARPTAGNSHIYKVTTAGTSSGTQPTWPTGSGATVVDNGVTWTEFGAAPAKTIGLTITGCTIDGAGQQGMLIDAEQVVISGCRIASTGTCVQVQAGAARVIIANNEITPGGSVAISTGNGTDQVTIRDNVIKGDGAATNYGIYAFNTGTNISNSGNVITGMAILQIAGAATAPRAATDISFETAVPAVAGMGYYPVGHTVMNTNGNLGEPAGWKVTTAGAPGTAVFKPFGIIQRITTQTGATYAGTASDRIIEVNRAGAVTVTLPVISTWQGDFLWVKDISGAAGANNITLSAGAGNTLEAATVIAANLGFRCLYPSGTVWRVVANE